MKAQLPAKKAANDAAAELVMDLRPLRVVKGDGFKALAQELILIGHQYGKVDVNSLMGDPKTLKRRIKGLAENEFCSPVSWRR